MDSRIGFLKTGPYIYVDIPDEKFLDMIYNLYMNDMKSDDYNDVVSLYYGTYLAFNGRYEESLEWYQKFADMNNRYAMRCLAHLYESGRGVVRDYKMACCVV